MMAPTEPLEELDLDALLATTQPHSIIGKPADTVERAAPPEENQFADLSGSLAAAPPSAPAAVSRTDELTTDLDFDLGEFAKELPPSAVAEPAPAPSAALDFGSIDFDLDPVAAPASAPVANAEAEADSAPAMLPAEVEPVSGIDLAPVGATTETLTPAPPASEAHAAFDALDGLDADEPAAPAGYPPSPAAADFDLDGINFDLGDPALLAGEGGEADPYSAEMSTKLDLALAYREIGDKEGARELLDEVVKSGSQQQIDKAKSLLAEMA
jgi:pilus assembly protein FimV